MLLLALMLMLAAAALGAYGFLGQRSTSPEVGERLQRFGSVEQLSPEERSAGPGPNAVAKAMDRAVAGKGLNEQIATLLARANVKMTVGEYLLLRLAATAGGVVFGLLAGLILLGGLLALGVAPVGALIGWMAPQIYMSRRAKRRTKKFEEQLGDTITLMANSLRAGYSLLQTMDLVSRDTAAPMSEEFIRVVREVGLGITPQDALAHLLRRITSEDLDLLVTAISIQHEVGGNLAQILDVIGETIRERVRIKGEIGVLTAQGRLSGYIITALPVGLGAFLFMINPSYERQIFVFPWIILPMFGGVLIFIGYMVIKKIVSIEV
ncbi:MAG TPA: type II secretion system F family protein [Steroidobacteraceae bacterium]|nr:type II secretion system F family protein [Steroidobacteraceae bacterium]